MEEEAETRYGRNWPRKIAAASPRRQQNQAWIGPLRSKAPLHLAPLFGSAVASIKNRLIDSENMWMNPVGRSQKTGIYDPLPQPVEFNNLPPRPTLDSANASIVTEVESAIHFRHNLHFSIHLFCQKFRTPK
jgi:hypothetical protein